MAFLHGFILSFGLILPLGPQNAFVFSQGATQARFLRALPVVLTAALCDTLLILLAVLGVSLVILTFSWVKTVLLIAGVGFLLYVGWITWKNGMGDNDQLEESNRWTRRRQIFFALSVSLLNPHAILDTVGVIGTSSLAYTGESKVAFTTACILNSWVWFFALVLAGRFAGRIDLLRRWLARGSAIIMWVSAVYLAITLR